MMIVNKEDDAIGEELPYSTNFESLLPNLTNSINLI